MQRKVWVDDEQYEQLKAISEKDGIPIAEQVRRAIREWLEKRQGKDDDAN
jgi:predicted DNA-binding protein